MVANTEVEASCPDQFVKCRLAQMWFRLPLRESCQTYCQNSFFAKKWLILYKFPIGNPQCRGKKRDHPGDLGVHCSSRINVKDINGASILIANGCKQAKTRMAGHLKAFLDLAQQRIRTKCISFPTPTLNHENVYTLRYVMQYFWYFGTSLLAIFYAEIGLYADDWALPGKNAFHQLLMTGKDIVD